MADSIHSYTIEPRPKERGDGWRLRLFTDGEEMGGGVFPPEANPEADAETLLDVAFAEAVAEGQEWLASRNE